MPVTDKMLFDDWPERYEHWFSTPIGRLVQATESRLILEMLNPAREEKLTGAFVVTRWVKPSTSSRD